MKKILILGLAALMLPASAAFAAVVQDWSALAGGAAGPFNDSNGSKIDFTIDAGPKAGQKALKITANVVTGGYAGIYTNTSGDISKAGALVFMAKSTVAGDIQIAIVDAFNVQYITKVSVPAGDWAPVTASLAAFIKDPYYTPPTAIAGHPMDLSKISNLNFSPQVQGSPVVVSIGPVETQGTASASTGSTASSTGGAVALGTGPAVQVLDLTGVANDGKSAGTFQDSQGSSWTFVAKDNPSKPGKKYLSVNFEMKQGGYCGMWCRAGGSDWSGADLSKCKTLSLTIYCKDPVILEIAMKDKNNNQYVANTPSTKGGKWETVVISLDSFHLDPYYTPPDAIKGAPKDFSKVGTFNIQASSAGKFAMGVDNVVGN